MADNIAVQPGVDAGRVDVLTDEKDGVHIPIYENLSLAVPQGKIPSIVPVNKFGYAQSGVQASDTDIWDRADSTPTQQIWTKPTQARTHQIKSTSFQDNNAIGSGAWKVKVFGLTSWDTKEVSEIINMNGTTNVPTVNQYVIIHRMRVVEFGLSNVNVGTITATADTDATVTAQISIGFGQTEMAIYGIPSIQDAYLKSWYASLNKSSGGAADVNFKLAWNPFPANPVSNYLTKEIRGLTSTGTSSDTWKKDPYKKFDGPGILVIRGIGSAADLDCTAGFDLNLVDA